MTLFILFLADYLIYGVIAIIPYLWITHHKDLALKALLSGILVGLIDYFFKYFFYTHRPFVTTGLAPLAGYLADGSFPSSHTAVAFAIAMTVGLHKHRMSLPIFMLAALVGLGRILGGVHYPFDVVAGALLGSLMALLVSNILLTNYQSK